MYVLMLVLVTVLLVLVVLFLVIVVVCVVAGVIDNISIGSELLMLVSNLGIFLKLVQSC